MAEETRVLIVDGDVDYHKLVRTQLAKSSSRYKVVAIRDHVDSLPALRDRKHDIYLVDAHLDGGRMWHVLVRQAVKQMCPLILTSDVEDELLADQVLALGACEFLYKGHMVDRLLTRTIRRVLVRHQRMVDMQKRQESLARLVHREPLTALFNRAALEEKIDEILIANDAAGGALLYIDLDGFKAINDQYGHLAGDQLLRLVARRLERCVRHGDLVGRIGGDEFVIYVNPALNKSWIPESPDAVARNVVRVIAQPYSLDDTEGCGTSISISASIGVAPRHHRGTRFAALVHEADRAMYLAKSSGGNQSANSRQLRRDSVTRHVAAG